MKLATDLEQSKKLAEFLPLETADMYWWLYKEQYYIGLMTDGENMASDIPAWSLSALLKLLDSYTLQTTSDGKCFIVADRDENTVLSTEYDEPVDACCEVINKLHIKGLL